MADLKNHIVNFQYVSAFDVLCELAKRFTDEEIIAALKEARQARPQRFPDWVHYNGGDSAGGEFHYFGGRYDSE